MTEIHLSRQQWLDACHFHDLKETEVLKEVSVRVKAERARGKTPVVLLDLDGTLYDVIPRTLVILKEWRDSKESAPYPKVKDALKAVSTQHIGYSLNDAFAALGLNRDDVAIRPAFEAAKDYWFKRFFSSEYLKYDAAFEGASQFVQEIHALGAHLIYLTGRDGPGMGDGTRENLIRDGFPWNVDRTELLLKKHSSFDDLTHKKEAASVIRARGELVASFENEPKNLVALQELFPEAMHVLVESFFSDHVAKPSKGLYRIVGFGTR